MTEENVARVERERDAKITVIVGNPPYNANQVNENDNNKNRKYEVVDGRIRDDLCEGIEGDAEEQALRSLREVHPLGNGPAERTRRDRVHGHQQQFCRRRPAV